MSTYTNFYKVVINIKAFKIFLLPNMDNSRLYNILIITLHLIKLLKDK